MNLKNCGGIIMKNENLDDIFNSDKLMKDIKKGKRKNLVRTVIITIVVFIVMFIVNNCISRKIGDMSAKNRSDLVRLSVPNGYISTTIDKIGLLGGISVYNISKYIGDKSIILEEDATIYGFSLEGVVLRSYEGGFNEEVYKKYPKLQWVLNSIRWKNGYRKMKFYHPDLQYKQYSKDLDILDDLPNDKLVEFAVSFDKKYKIEEIENVIPNINKSWYWFDAFTKEEMKNYKEKIDKNEINDCYIRECEVLGINVGKNKNSILGIFKDRDTNESINMLLNSLNKSSNKRYNEIYDELMSKGYKDSSNMPVLGVIVYGTKEDLKKLKENPHIKAVSVGVITDKY